MKMKVPEGCSGCSFEGKNYKANKKGEVDVPDEAVSILMSHGLEHIVPTDEEVKAANVEAARQAVAAAQGDLDAETDEEKKQELERVLEAAEAALAALEG